MTMCGVCYDWSGIRLRGGMNRQRPKEYSVRIVIYDVTYLGIGHFHWLVDLLIVLPIGQLEHIAISPAEHSA